MFSLASPKKNGQFLLLHFFSSYLLEMYVLYTEQNYKRNTFDFAPIMSWTQISKTFYMYTKGLFLPNIVHKSV